MELREVEFKIERNEKWVPVGCKGTCMFMDGNGESHRCKYLVDVIPMSQVLNTTVRCSKNDS